MISPSFLNEMLILSVYRVSWRAFAKGESFLVSTSARLAFPRLQVKHPTIPVYSSYFMHATTPLVHLSVDFRCVDKGVKRSLLSTQRSTLMSMNRVLERAIAMLFVSSIVSDETRISAAGTNFTGLLDF